METKNISPSVPSREPMEVKFRENQFLQVKCQNETKDPYLKCRYIVVAFNFLIFYVLNGYKVSMGVSIVAMVNTSAISLQKKTVSVSSCPHLIPDAIEEKDNFLKNDRQDGEFAWSPEIQGYVLGSYFLGYVISLIPGGGFVERFGCKWFLFGATFVTAVCTFLIPLLSSQDATALIALQALRGLAQGTIQPACSILTANWFPRPERGLFHTIVQSGAALGGCLAGLITGFLCDSLGRWPSSFYTFGTGGFITSALIAFFMHESPKDHPNISKAELDYILSNQECTLSKRRPKLPLSKIMTSVPVYAIIYASFGQLWAISQFLSVYSTFLGTILHYPIKENGFFSSLPFLLQFVAAQLAGWLSSYMLRKNIATLSHIRKLWNFLSSLGYSACLLGVYFAACNRHLSLAFSILSAGFTGFSFAGCWIVASDMTPTFAGSFNALCLTFACTSSVFLPLVVGYLTDGMQTIEQWNKVFFISIGIVMSSGIAFAIFGSAEVQPWNSVSEEKENKEEEKVEQTRF